MNKVLSDYAIEFSQLNPADRVRYLVELGRELTPCSDCKSDNFKVPRCMSSTYVRAFDDNGLVIEGYSNALSIAGYLVILQEAFTGMPVADFKKNARLQISEFLSVSKLPESLLSARYNSLVNIIDKILEQV